MKKSYHGIIAISCMSFESCRVREHCVAEVDASGDPVRSYVHGPGIDNLLAITTYGTETNTYYTLTDHLGTVTALADDAGAVAESYAYDAWGNITVYDENDVEIPQSQYGNRFTFQGREYSWATGLYNFRARWYDPETGRWLSKDPIGISGGLNQYVAFGNNPVNFRDPLGLWQVTIGGGYGYAGRVTFGKNNGRWNIGGGFGYGIGLMGEFTPEDSAPAFASEGKAPNIGVEVSGGAKLWNFLDLSAGYRARAEADGCDNVETRIGAIDGLTLPGYIINVNGSADVVFQGNTSQVTFEAFPELSSEPVSFGLGVMVFAGGTGGFSWQGGPSK